MAADSTSAGRLAQAAGFVVNLPAYVWLLICGLLMALIYYFAFTNRYALSDYGDKPYQSVATLSGYSAEGAFLYIGGFAALFGLYWFGLRRGLRPASWHEWALVGIFAIIFNVILLSMYPLDAADIYDNIIRGRMSAVYGLNPMINTPNEIRSDPFYRFAAPTWHDTPSAYGPAWELMSSLQSRIAGDDPTANVIVFKVFVALCYGLTALFIGLTLRLLAPQRTLIGVYLFAWNPLVIFMTAGTGHNDATMALFVVLSIYLLARRWYAASTLTMLIGALVKFIPALLIPIIVIVAYRRLTGSARVRYFAISAVGGALLLVLLYGPSWHGFETLGISRRTSMFTGSVATLARQTLGPVFDGQTGEAYETPNTNAVLVRVILGLFGLFYLYRLDHIFRAPVDDDPVYPVREMLIILLAYLLVAATWFQPWYAVWVVALAALLDNTPMRRLILYFGYLVTWQTFMYNYVTLRPEGWAPIPWRDLLPIAITMGVAWSYIAIFWVTDWLRRGKPRSELAQRIGQRIHEAREGAQLSISDVADRLDLRTDDLIGYERGDRPILLDKLESLSEALNIPVSEFTKS